MLQYRRTENWSAIGKIINFNRKISNFGMGANYNNGVVAITDSGIYLVQSELRYTNECFLYKNENSFQKFWQILHAFTAGEKLQNNDNGVCC